MHETYFSDFPGFLWFPELVGTPSSCYRSKIQYWNVRFGQDSHLSRVYTIKSSSIYKLKLCTPVACYAVDGDWTAIEAWRAVLKAWIVWTPIVVGGSLFQSWMSLGRMTSYTLWHRCTGRKASVTLMFYCRWTEWWILTPVSRPSYAWP